MVPSLEWVIDKNLTNEQMNEWDKWHIVTDFSVTLIHGGSFP